MNLPGSYNCSCNVKFTGDGYNCIGMCLLHIIHLHVYTFYVIDATVEVYIYVCIHIYTHVAVLIYGIWSILELYTNIVASTASKLRLQTMHGPLTLYMSLVRTLFPHAFKLEFFLHYMMYCNTVIYIFSSSGL